MSEIVEEIIEIIAKRAAPGKTVYERAHLYEDLYISTSDFEEIAEEIYEKYGTRMSADDFRSGKISSVQDVVDNVKSESWGSRTFSGCDDDDYSTSDDVADNNETHSVTYSPSDIKGWNWGACLLGWIWGLFNGAVKQTLLMFLLSTFVPFIGSIASMILLGIKGNEWAWQGKNWSSVDEFKRVQRKWAVAGVCVAVIVVLIVLNS